MLPFAVLGAIAIDQQSSGYVAVCQDSAGVVDASPVIVEFRYLDLIDASAAGPAAFGLAARAHLGTWWDLADLECKAGLYRAAVLAL